MLTLAPTGLPRSFARRPVNVPRVRFERRTIVPLISVGLPGRCQLVVMARDFPSRTPPAGAVAVRAVERGFSAARPSVSLPKPMTKVCGRRHIPFLNVYVLPPVFIVSFADPQKNL